MKKTIILVILLISIFTTQAQTFSVFTNNTNSHISFKGWHKTEIGGFFHDFTIDQDNNLMMILSNEIAIGKYNFVTEYAGFNEFGLKLGISRMFKYKSFTSYPILVTNAKEIKIIWGNSLDFKHIIISTTNIFSTTGFMLTEYSALYKLKYFDVGYKGRNFNEHYVGFSYTFKF